MTMIIKNVNAKPDKKKVQEAGYLVKLMVHE
jgi:hypothetical protein